MSTNSSLVLFTFASLCSVACGENTRFISADRFQNDSTSSTNWDNTEYTISAPVFQVLDRLIAESIRNDGYIRASEAQKLVAFTKGFHSPNQEVQQYLQEILHSDIVVHPDARAILENGLRIHDDVALKNSVYEIKLGTQDFLFDDALYLRFNGSIEGSTQLYSHSRGYAAKTDGVLFTRHGSIAPHYWTTNSQEQSEEIRNIGPDEALDIAAKIYGLELNTWNTFSHIAHDSNFYDPSESTPYWAGICQGWTHNALDDRLSILVDVEGSEGTKGLWIFGQWISRADLGNAMMGASYSLGIADSTTIDSFVTPDSLVKALGQYVLRSGIGLRVDIWNDEHNSTNTYNPQIWNQPIVEASIEVSDVSTQVKSDIIQWARRQSTTGNSQDYHAVRFVQATGIWGAETNDSWEGAPYFKSSEWNMYMITNFEGKVVASFMAYDLVESNIANLPTTTSDGLPDYIAIPKHELTDASLYDSHHRLLEDSTPEGARFRFLVGTVLARGIPDHTRKAFEEDVFAERHSATELATLYPGIANAYSPTQWDETFASTLGRGEKFGAVWNTHNQ